jgi:hypothetical protein
MWIEESNDEGMHMLMLPSTEGWSDDVIYVLKNEVGVTYVLGMGCVSKLSGSYTR